MRLRVPTLSLSLAVMLVGCATDDDGGAAPSDPADCEDGKCDGPRRFPLPTKLDLGGDTSSVAIADVDRDGYVDLAAFVAPRGQRKLELVLAYGDARGTWTHRYRRAIPGSFEKFTRDTSSSVVVIRDVDRDGRLDLVTASGIAMGRASRAFTWRTLGGEMVNALQAVEVVQRDGATHVIRGTNRGIVERCTIAGQCTALPGNPPACGSDVDCAVRDLVVADFTGDGVVDIISGRPAEGSNDLRMWSLRDGWTTPTVIRGDGMDAEDLEAGDVDKDGVSDLVLQQNEFISDFPSNTHVLLATPRRTAPFGLLQSLYNNDNHNDNMALADLDGDGCLDLSMIGVDTSAIAVRRGIKAGARCVGYLGPHAPTSGGVDVGWTTVEGRPGTIGVQVLDVNGDRKLEWVLRARETVDSLDELLLFHPVTLP